MSRFVTTVGASLLIGLWGISPVAAATGEADFTHMNVGALMIPILEGNPQPPGYQPGQYYPSGSGTLLHERVFLTAGHVTFGVSAGVPLELVYVSFDRDTTGVSLGDPIPSTWRPVAQLITHPGFTSPANRDIGVAILADPVTDLTPATLPTGIVFDQQSTGTLMNTTFTLVGYGAAVEFTQGDVTPPPDSLFPPFEFTFEDLTRKFADIKYQSQSGGFACFLLHVDAADATLDQAGGPGDSGGPIFMRNADGSETLVAVVKGPCGTGPFGRTQRLDIPEVRDFIDAVIASVEGE